MNELQFAGARWWKCDFHTHTPASMDFSDKNMSPESWLNAFMDKEIDCVAITDHNSGEWIDDLKIVVNGDAEMVLPLEAITKEGLSQTEVQHPASIQQRNVRESICNILEGGERAFKQRYKRIHLGD